MRDVCGHEYLDSLAENEALNRIEIAANSLCRLVAYADGTPLGPVMQCVNTRALRQHTLHAIHTTIALVHNHNQP